MAFKPNNSPLQQSIFRSAAGQDWKSNYWENKRKADYARGKAEVQAEILSRQPKAANTFDRAGMPIKADPNAIVQPPQPAPPVDMTPGAAVINNNNNFNQRSMTPQQPQSAPINPNAFTNQASIQGVYGQAMPGTFNRSVGPLAQMVDPATGQPMDASNPLAPPAEVATPIAPVYDINNY